MDNYSLVKKYDTLSTDNKTGEKIKYAFNWISVKHKNNKSSGIAMIYGEDNVQFIANDDKDDMIVSKNEFNKNFIIEKITDHWGNEIEEAKSFLEKNNNRKINIFNYFKNFLLAD